MLECVINISEGRSEDTLRQLASSAAAALLDVHTDADHHRSVFTLAGPDVERAARSLARQAIGSIHLDNHVGQHPRIGVVDVVPFVPLDGSTLQDAEAARDRFAEWLAKSLEVPAFLYGHNRSLPEVRAGAFVSLQPDMGPLLPHPSAGACAVGAREVLVAYNLWLDDVTLGETKRLAKELRRPGLRALALSMNGSPQLSCNLTAPFSLGPGAVYDLVAERAAIKTAELVGLMPGAVLAKEPVERWQQLDIGPDRTIEARLEKADFNRGKTD